MLFYSCNIGFQLLRLITRGSHFNLKFDRSDFKIIVWPKNSFPLCLSPFKISLGPQKMAVFLDHLHICGLYGKFCSQSVLYHPHRNITVSSLLSAVPFTAHEVISKTQYRVFNTVQLHCPPNHSHSRAEFLPWLSPDFLNLCQLTFFFDMSIVNKIWIWEMC